MSRVREQSGKHLLSLRLSQLDPQRTSQRRYFVGNFVAHPVPISGSQAHDATGQRPPTRREGDQMRRRDLIAGLVLASLGTPALAAVKQISILRSGFPNRTPVHLLIEALRALGYEDGNTASVELLGGEADAKRL